ncbi:hypothetical protein PaG_01874 [Moesziomyces aphidis]|uniref:Uncharacterized protein n=1 Tax=Moesziomyces aphidis TaxID=84754 RepID=W3VRZ9_MOEAP|nr:hypothetical protein PaG_01874 [Moesziomyces aphidis]
MAAPWTWRLDPSSGSASVLGPSPSTIAVSADPLSALAQSTETASADDIVWHDFGPPPRPTSARQARKRARLNRFDSDDDENFDQTLRTEPSSHDHADAVPGPVAELDAQEAREDDENAGLASTCSSDSESNDEDPPLREPQASQSCSLQLETRKHPEISLQKARKSTRTNSEDAFAESTRLMAHTIYTYSLADEAKRPENTDPPSPLTYKETVRLVRLIAMIFRFPKPTRRVSRRHTDSADIASPPSSSQSTPTPAVKDESDDEKFKIELKPKYLSSASDGGSRRPRMLARVHPEDTRVDSAAVLKMLALVPSVLPARVGDAAWIVNLAVRARRDEYGNILLPDSVYASAQPADTHTGSTTCKGENEGPQKITRSLVHKLGREAPAIPLPQFWRRRSPSASATHESDCKEHNAQERPLPNAQANVETLTTSAAETQQDAAAAEESGERAVNLSRLLADRMREKRQAKTLLLRTHPTLRKRRPAQTSSQAVQHDAENEADALTAANTAANALSHSQLPLPDHVE